MEYLFESAFCDINKQHCVKEDPVQEYGKFLAVGPSCRNVDGSKVILRR